MTGGLRRGDIVAKKIDGKCPCCGEEVTVEYKPAMWQDEKDKVVIEHKKWPPGWNNWQDGYRNNMNLSRR